MPEHFSRQNDLLEPLVSRLRAFARVSREEATMSEQTHSGLFVLVLMLCGCATSTDFGYFALEVPPHTMVARPGSDVELLTAAPGCPFVEVGIIQSEEGRSRDDDNAKAQREALRAEAGALGCDALWIHEPDETAASNQSGDMMVSEKEYLASCVVYWEADAADPCDSRR
jgi:hypothetical protein